MWPASIISSRGSAGGAASYVVSARLDQDGDALAQYGDVQGQTAEPARVGGPPTTLRLTQVLGGKTAGTLPPMSTATFPKS